MSSLQQPIAIEDITAFGRGVLREKFVLVQLTPRGVALLEQLRTGGLVHVAPRQVTEALLEAQREDAPWYTVRLDFANEIRVMTSPIFLEGFFADMAWSKEISEGQFPVPTLATEQEQAELPKVNVLKIGSLREVVRQTVQEYVRREHEG